MRALILSLAMLSPSAMADSLEFHFASEHIGGGNYNETNLGLGYNKGGYTAGFYKNSHSDTSFYAGKVFEYGKLSFIVGGVTYDELLPLVSAQYRVFDKKVSPVVTYAPTQDGGVFLLSVDWRL